MVEMDNKRQRGLNVAFGILDEQVFSCIPLSKD